MIAQIQGEKGEMNKQSTGLCGAQHCSVCSMTSYVIKAHRTMQYEVNLCKLWTWLKECINIGSAVVTNILQCTLLIILGIVQDRGKGMQKDCAFCVAVFKLYRGVSLRM